MDKCYQNFDLKNCSVKLKQLSQNGIGNSCSNINTSETSITEGSFLSVSQSSWDLLLDVKTEDEFIESEIYDQIHSPNSFGQVYEHIVLPSIPIFKVEESIPDENVTFSDQIYASNKRTRKLIKIYEESLKFVKASGDPLSPKESSSEYSSAIFNIEFFFDCEARCGITLKYFCTKVAFKSGFSFVPQDPSRNSQTFIFESGSNQKFSQENHIFDLSKFPEESLGYSEDDKIIPIVICCSPEDDDSFQSLATTAIIERQAGAFLLKVFELKDIQSKITPSKYSYSSGWEKDVSKHDENFNLQQNGCQERIETNLKNVDLSDVDTDLDSDYNCDALGTIAESANCDKKADVSTYHLEKLSERRRIIRMHKSGMSIKCISKKLGRDRKTVRTWIKRWIEEGNLKDHQRTGSKRKTTAATDQMIAELARANPFSNAVAIRNHLNLKVTARTVWNRLNENRDHHRHTALREKLSDQNKHDRLAFAQQYVNEDLNYWSRVIFTGEKTFSSSDHGKLHCWRLNNTRYAKQNIIKLTNSGHVTSNVWGWINSTGVGEITDIQESFNAEAYVEILEEIMLPTVRTMNFPYPERFIYMHNICPIHNSRVTRQFFDEHPDIELLEWPSKGYDMNPIENIWAIMINEWEIQQQKNSNQLYHHVMRAWERLRGRQNVVQNIIDSMPQRLTSVIESDGGWNSY